MHLSQIQSLLEEIAPTQYAEPWDNVGLLVGDPTQSVHKILLTIDYTPAVAEEGRQQGCDLIVAYHPPIFHAIKSVRADGATELIFDALRREVAIYSPHTALDVAPGGVNDFLADAMGLTERQPLRPRQGKASNYKLVVFVPHKALQQVSQALFAAGCGGIGKYTQCSFRVPGTGTFMPQAGADPAVGEVGRLEETAELRLETLLPIDRISDAITSLRKSHPYEEPAFELVQLALPPDGLGLGRIGSWNQPVDRSQIISRIARNLQLSNLLIAGPAEGPIQKGAVCAGASGELLDDAVAKGAQILLTGEVRHHDALRAASCGMTVVCTLHSNSERAYLKKLATTLGEKLSRIPILIAQKDADPFVVQRIDANNA